MSQLVLFWEKSTSFEERQPKWTHSLKELKKCQKLEFFEKNRKKLTNSRFLLMTIFSMLSANSFTSQGHLIAKKNCGRGNIITCAAFFFFLGKDDSFYSNLLRITWFMEKISLPANWTLTWHLVIYKCQMSMLCWTLGHAEQLLFSCLCSKVTVYRWTITVTIEFIELVPS